MEVNPHKHDWKMLCKDDFCEIRWCRKCGRVEVEYWGMLGHSLQIYEVGSLNVIE